MVAIVGTFLNGYVKLDKEYSTKNPVKAIVTFLQEVETPTEKGFSLSDFSFSKSQKKEKTLKVHLVTQLLKKEGLNYENINL